MWWCFFSGLPGHLAGFFLRYFCAEGVGFLGKKLHRRTHRRAD